MIIYIHGFGGCGEGSKAKVFRKYFKSIGAKFIAPSLSYVPTLAIKTLDELIESYQEDVYLIGSSLGGYYTTYLSQKKEVKKVILINPAVKPTVTLSRALGDALNYYDESYYSWNKKHLDMLTPYEYKFSSISVRDKENFLLMVQKGDTLLDYNEAVEKYDGAIQIVEEGGNHSFENIENHFETIKKFFAVGDSSTKELYSTKIYKDTLAFALKAHGEQKTPEGLPYSFHIVSVANEIINSLSMNRISYDEANVAIACALLHDVNEDTQEKVTKYNIEFPDQNVDMVVSGVSALTKDETLFGKQKQMEDSLRRLKELPHCVQMVKLADRITNLAPAPLFWNKSKRQNYVDEAKKIFEALKDSNPYLASKLKNKIDNYLVSQVLDSRGVKNDDDYMVFYTQVSQLVLDKDHKNYLKTFKAINRLNDYILKTYELSLFKREDYDLAWENRDKKQIEKYTNSLGFDYIKEILGNQSDEKIENYMRIISNGEDCIKMQRHF